MLSIPEKPLMCAVGAPHAPRQRQGAPVLGKFVTYGPTSEVKVMDMKNTIALILEQPCYEHKFLVLSIRRIRGRMVLIAVKLAQVCFVTTKSRREKKDAMNSALN
jgi:hypothetical protein